MKIITVLLLSSGVSGCNLFTRLSQVGEPPELTLISDPTLVDGYRPVSMPMPYPETPNTNVNSLWQTGSRAFFKDQRAGRVGDILTVFVRINDQSNINTTYQASRQTTQTSSMTNLFGFESELHKFLPAPVNNTALTNLASNPNVNSTGKINRQDQLTFKMAATIIQVLPNGTFVIQGRQEVRIGTDARLIDLRGIIRREDISSDNTIDYEKISEARISYGLKGDIADTNQVPWGVQALNRALPF